MSNHRNPHPRLSKAPPTDNLMDEARRRLVEAAALVSAAAVAIRDVSDRDDRNRLADLIAAVERAMPMEAP